MTWTAQRYPVKTHCRRGHPFDEGNTGIDARGTRRCKACCRERMKKWFADHPEVRYGNAYRKKETKT